jgi:uncharacterized protein YggL (DUF469 family)
MRKRVRKKKRLGKYREYGFCVSFEIGSPAKFDLIFDRFIVEAIEGNGLLFGGSPASGFVTAAQRRASSTERDRERVRHWLEQQSEVKNVKVGELRDAWHGWKWPSFE